MKKFTIVLTLALLAALIPATAMACPPDDPLCASFTFTSSGTITGENPSSLDNKLSFTGVTANVTDPSAINLGYFSLANIGANGTGTFNLTVNFTAPAGVQDPSYTGTTVTFDDLDFLENWDQATIAFSNAVKHLTFTGGSFDFQLQPTSLTVEYIQPLFSDSYSTHPTLYGQISNVQCNIASVPEPGSIVLFGTLLSGVCLFLKKRKA